MSNSEETSKWNKRKAERESFEINNGYKICKSDSESDDNKNSLKFSDVEGSLTYSQLLSIYNSEGTLEEETSQNIKLDVTKLCMISESCEIVSKSNKKWAFSGEIKNIPFNKENEFYAKIGSRPIDYFSYFLEDDLLHKLCTETNAYAENLFYTTAKTEQSKITAWRELNVPEIKIFLGLLIHMGTISMNKLQDYWKVNRLFNLPIFAEQMSINRFTLILRCLSFNSNSEKHDEFSEIKDFINYFNNKMDECYYPGKVLTLDDSIVLWRNRLKIRQHIKNRCRKNGYKLYTLTEPDGTVLKFNVYKGTTDTDNSNKIYSEHVVLDLLKGKLGCGHSLYLDNFYNSYSLAKKLLDNDTYCTSKLRLDLPNNPIEVIQKALRRRENISMFKDGVHIGKYRDEQTITYITTEFENEIMTTRNKYGQVTKPEAISHYNDQMQRTKRREELLSFYPLEKMCLSWHKKITIHIFQLLLLNSYKFYNKYSGSTKTNFYGYRLAVINKLLPKKSKYIAKNKLILPDGHIISRITNRSKGRIIRKICRNCSKKKIRKDSSFHCTACPNNPGLCLECFQEYHKVN